MNGDGKSLISYRLRTVRVGVQATFLVLAALALFPLIPSSSVDLDEVSFYVIAGIAALGAILVHFLPWKELFKDHRGMWTMYVWSVFDILLITALIATSGGDESPLFLLYGLTTVFFAASYPPRAQLTLFVFTFICYFFALQISEDHIVIANFFVRLAILASLTYITSFLSRELIDQNAHLETEIAEHEATEAELRKRESELEEAQKIAHLGSWAWDIETNDLVWSSELFRIYGGEPGNFGGDYEAFLNTIHEEDRDRVEQIVLTALENLQPFDFEHRVVRPDGTLRVVQARGRVEADGDRPVRMFGTALDITETKKAEENERQIHDMQMRQRQAVELNDTVVQGLAVAGYALDAKDSNRAKTAITRTLAAARSIVNKLLNVDNLEPGDLVRSESATVIADDEDFKEVDAGSDRPGSV